MSTLNQNSSYRPIRSFDHLHGSISQTPSRFNIVIEDTSVKLPLTRRNGSTFSRSVNRLWILEWLSWLVALLAIAGIVGVLAAFNHKPIPDWPYGITLGALVSLLATIANVGLAGPIGAGLGQAKWLWFARERRMADFELVDDASRGPYKSAILLVRGKGGMIALWGAILTIITLAVGPFVQQVVQYEDSAVQSGAAAIPIATEYNTYEISGGILDKDVTLDMKAAIQRGLLDINANSTTFFVSPQCPTGNCTWDLYTTLGVCASCTDLSSHLFVQTNNDSTVTTSLPNHVTLNSYPSLTKQGFIAMTVNTTSDLLSNLIPSIAYTEWSKPLADVFTIIAQYGDVNTNQLSGPYASECILQFCVQDHASAVSKGTFNEQNLNTPRYINYSSSLVLTDGGTNYMVELETYSGFWTYFKALFNTQVHQQNGLFPTAQWPDGVSQSIFYGTNGSHDHSPTQMFANLASSMSLNIRSLSRVSISGTAISLQSVVSVHWPWMVLPFALLALVLAYLVAVVRVSKISGQEPWKTSSMAVLMHGLMDDESRGLVEGLERLDEMEVVSSQLRMKIVRTAENSRTSGEEERSHIGFIARY